MPENNDLDAAHDYREQLQARNYRPVNVSPEILINLTNHLKTVFPGQFNEEKSPWELLSDFLIEKDIEEITLAEAAELVLTEIKDKEHPLYRMAKDSKFTKYDSLFSSDLLEYIENIKVACKDLNISVRDGVSIGFNNEEALKAEQQPVWLTESSVINISESLYIILNRVSKLLAKSISFERLSEDSGVISLNIEKHKKKILNDIELQKEWELFFTDCAYDTDNPLLGNVVVVSDEFSQACYSDIMESMTYFILGHEFGHHALEHSLGGTSEKSVDESLNMEFDADLFACKISAHIAKSDTKDNYFLQSNLGAFFALNILNLIRYSYQIVKNGKVSDSETPSDSHPHIKDRIEKIYQFIETSENHSNKKFATIALHNTMFDLLEFIWGNTRNNLLRMHIAGCAPKDRSKKNWLPGV
ncbi:hypothetical protein CWB96_17875 [Pseudoalteromonas citrea]|uniref:Uncharacterized protein n=1 Tax=Pseudoalteromonas citrea TaxID=43655 RepID=A0A5S3XL61_9GAMM|nr:hypothetical protein [Pseudoalteromonas citrea]TMP41301.1 hypothetical protein CWB97_15125 [Pseudoalteromonas citrea]TMP55109.1 hypothetical protein CWB96_17875 [Pseudoalteromonas citrea]